MLANSFLFLTLKCTICKLKHKHHLKKDILRKIISADMEEFGKNDQI